MEMDIGASRFDVKESPGKIVIQDKIEKMILTGNFNTADALKEVSEYFNGPGRVDIDGIESYFQWESGLRANLGDDVYSGSEYVKVPLDEIKIGNQNFKIGLSPGRIVIQDEEYRKYYTGNFDAAAAQTVARDLVSRFNGENINLSGIDRYIESKREARDGNIYRNIDDDTGAEVTDLNTKQERRIGASRFEVERSLDEIVFKDGTEKYTLTGDFNTVRATAEIVADVENYFEGRGNVDVEEIDTYLVHDSNFRRNIVGRDFDSADSNIERIDIGDRHSFKVGVSPGKVVFQDEGASEIRYTGDFDIITARTMVNSLVDRFDGQSADINDVTGYIKDRMTAQDDNIYRHNITRVEEGEQENEADRENAGPGQEAAEAEPAETVKAKSPEEAAFLNALHQRKVIAESLKDGTLACLPGPDGLADTEPAVNLANGTRYHGSNQLYLKDFQKKNGFPTAEFVTSALVEKSGIPIRKGQHGVWIDFRTQNEQTGQWEQKNIRLFNIAQAVNPAKLKAFAENTAQEKQQEKEEYLSQMYGSAYRPRKPQEKKPGKEIVCSSTDPEKYLGQYLAAVSTGGTFRATREQAAAFSRKMGSSLFERSANGHTNPFKLSKICNAAGEHCRNAVKEAYAPKTEQKQEFRRGRSM